MPKSSEMKNQTETDTKVVKMQTINQLQLQLDNGRPVGAGPVYPGAHRREYALGGLRGSHKLDIDADSCMLQAQTGTMPGKVFHFPCTFLRFAFLFRFVLCQRMCKSCQRKSWFAQPAQMMAIKNKNKKNLVKVIQMQFIYRAGSKVNTKLTAETNKRRKKDDNKTIAQRGSGRKEGRMCVDGNTLKLKLK